MKPWLHKLNQWTKTIWPALIWSAFVFVVLMIPGNKLPNEKLIPIPHFDKLVHFLLFGVFAYLWDLYLRKRESFIKERKRALLILFIIFMYGLLLEYLQLFIGRKFDVIDLISDMSGILLIIKPGRNLPGFKKHQENLI
jgi:VanZ family protein